MGAALFSLCPGGEKQRGCGGGTPLPSGRGFGDGAAETKRYSPIRQQASRASRRTRARRGRAFPLCSPPSTPQNHPLALATPIPSRAPRAEGTALWDAARIRAGGHGDGGTAEP